MTCNYTENPPPPIKRKNGQSHTSNKTKGTNPPLLWHPSHTHSLPNMYTTVPAQPHTLLHSLPYCVRPKYILQLQPTTYCYSLQAYCHSPPYCDKYKYTVLLQSLQVYCHNLPYCARISTYYSLQNMYNTTGANYSSTTTVYMTLSTLPQCLLNCTTSTKHAPVPQSQ
jgi:hypothetical protein